MTTRSGSRRSKSSRRVSSETAVPLKRRRPHSPDAAERGALYSRWFWPSFAMPGTAYLLLFFLFPFYVILAVTFGTVDPILRQPVPAWNPLHWSFGVVSYTFSNITHSDGLYQAPFVHTFVFA